MKTISLLAATALAFCLSSTTKAADGTLDAPIELSLFPVGKILQREARIEKHDRSLFYEFTLTDWADLSVTFPKLSGHVTIPLLSDDWLARPSKNPLASSRT